MSSKRRSTRNTKNRTSRSSVESQLDESDVLEERLKALLTNGREQNQRRNIFNYTQEVPRLRRSVVVRAVQNVVCSTPMPAEKRRDFFNSENSFNISPIDPISEEGEQNVDDKVPSVEQNPEFENECKDYKEVQVILTRASLPIVISDSEDEDVGDIEKPEGSKKIGEKMGGEVNQDAVSEFKKDICKQKVENSKCTETIRGSSALKKNKTVSIAEQPNDENLEENCTLSDKSNSTSFKSRNTVSNKKNKKQNRSPHRKLSKRTRNNKTLRNKSSNQVLAEVCSTDLLSTPHESLKCNSIGKNQSNSDMDQNINIKTTFSESKINQNASKQVFISPNLKKTDCSRLGTPLPTPKKNNVVQDNVNLKCNQNKNGVPDSCKTKITTRSQNVSMNKSKTIQEDNNSKNNVIPLKSQTDGNIDKNLSSHSGRRDSAQYRISPKKLTFTSKDQDKCNENVPIQAQKDEDAEIKKDREKLSKIPLLRSRSRSKDKKSEINESILNQKNVNCFETLQENNESENRENPGNLKFFPKRPHRKKKQSSGKLSATSLSKTNSDVKLKEDIGKDNATNLLKELTVTECVNQPTPENQLVVENSINKFTPDSSGIKILNSLQNQTCFEDENKNKQIINDAGVHTNQVNCKSTFVEVGTSPLQFTPNDNAKKNISQPKQMVEAGTSTSNFSHQGGLLSVVDRDKEEKLSKLILKISQGCLDTALSNSTSTTTAVRSQKDFCDKKNSNTSEFLPDISYKPYKLRKTQREEPIIETSDKIIQTSIEYQTQTIGPLVKELSNSSKNSFTDHSEIIASSTKEDSRSPILFESLKNDIPNFSSSDEEAFDDILDNKDEEKGPWRLDDSLQYFPRRSSYKLNFLRSAQEIEMERKSQIYNQSNSELQAAKRKDRQLSAQVCPLIYKKRSELQKYIPQSVKPKQLGSARSSSDSSVMSHLAVTESNSDQSDKESKEPKLVTNNISQLSEKNYDLEYQHKTNNHETLKMLMQDIRENVINQSYESHNQNSNLQINSPYLARKKKKPNKNNQTLEINGNLNMQSLKIGLETNSIRKSFVHIGLNDDEVLAIPLDNSAHVEHPSEVRRVESTRNAKLSNEGSVINKKGAFEHKTENTAHNKMKNHGSSNKQISPKKLAQPKASRSSRKNVIPENDDGISSTTLDSGDITGLRRSGRNRKVPHRPFCGAILTRSEKVLQRYNGSSMISNTSDVTEISSLKTRKRSTITRQNVNDDVFAVPEVKKGRGGRKKKNTAAKSVTTGPVNTKDLDENSDKNKIANKYDSTQVEVNVTAKNDSDNHTNDVAVSSTDNENNISNTHSISQDVTPNKKNNDSQVINSSDIKGSPKGKIRKSSLNYSLHNKSPSYLRSKHLNFNMNTSQNRSFNSNVADIDVNMDTSDKPVEGNFNNFSSELHPETNTDFALHTSNREDVNSIGEFTDANKLLEKDSGRSTMCKSTTFEESNVRTGKPLRGRITKNYKKKDNMHTKISKILSRSNNISTEYEIMNENELNVADSPAVHIIQDVRLTRSSISQTTLVENQYINLLSDNNLLSIKYMEKVPKFKLVNNDLLVTDVLRNNKDGGTMGYLKLPPGCQKPLHIARKFALFYFVIEGEGSIQVHNKTSKISKLSTFIVPLGVEYFIYNSSKEDTLILGFVKMPCNRS